MSSPDSSGIIKQMSSASKSIITKDEIIKLAMLSSLELTEEEVTRYQQEVSTILEMIDKLKEINTDGVEPTYQVSGNKNVTRDDEIQSDTVSPAKLLNLSPDSLKDQIKVKKVL
jgi:aspartyl-tRNA(Asn)/glutamyl-tRNA(Gln) amidotransferase subunit C